MKYFLLNTEAHNLKRNSKQLLQKKTAWKVKFKIKRGKPICVRVIASDCQLLLLLLFIALAFFTNLLSEFFRKNFNHKKPSSSRFQRKQKRYCINK